MASSELGHYVRFGESLMNADEGVDTGMMRRAVGNTNHVADQYAQTRCRWTLGSHQTPLGWPVDVGSPAVDTYYPIWSGVPLDHHVRLSKGALETYRMRVRLRIDSNSGTDQAVFRAVLAFPGQAVAEREINGPNVAQFAVTSTTTAWVDGASLIYLDEYRVRAFRALASTLNSVGGGNVSAPWLRLQLTVFGKTISGGGAPRLHGVELTEYVHP